MRAAARAELAGAAAASTAPSRMTARPDARRTPLAAEESGVCAFRAASRGRAPRGRSASPDALPASPPVGSRLVPALVASLRQAWRCPSVPRASGWRSVGAPDSAMLAVHAAAVARDLGVGVALFHAHHGLQAAADAWSEHVQRAGPLAGPARGAGGSRVEQAGGKGVRGRCPRRAAMPALAPLARRRARNAMCCWRITATTRLKPCCCACCAGTGLAGMAAMAPASLARRRLTYLRPLAGARTAPSILLAADVG